MIEIHDDWHYVTLWYAQGPRADYTVLAFRRAHATGCEITARFRHLKGEDDRKAGLIDGTEGWFPVPCAPGAQSVYVNALMETVVNNLAAHPEFGEAGSVVVHRHHINSGGTVFREVLAHASWAA